MAEIPVDERIARLKKDLVMEKLRVKRLCANRKEMEIEIDRLQKLLYQSRRVDKDKSDLIGEYKGFSNK